MVYDLGSVQTFDRVHLVQGDGAGNNVLRKGGQLTVCPLKGSPCQWSKMVNSDACPRPTTGDLDGRRRLVHGAGQAVPYGPGPLGAVKRP